MKIENCKVNFVITFQFFRWNKTEVTSLYDNVTFDNMDQTSQSWKYYSYEMEQNITDFSIDDIRKASVILGLKPHLKQNFRLNNLAKQINIPLYTLNQVSVYQISKWIKLIKYQINFFI